MDLRARDGNAGTRTPGVPRPRPRPRQGACISHELARGPGPGVSVPRAGAGGGLRGPRPIQGGPGPRPQVQGDPEEPRGRVPMRPEASPWPSGTTGPRVSNPACSVSASLARPRRRGPRSGWKMGVVTLHQPSPPPVAATRGANRAHRPGPGTAAAQPVPRVGARPRARPRSASFPRERCGPGSSFVLRPRGARWRRAAAARPFRSFPGLPFGRPLKALLCGLRFFFLIRSGA